MLKASAHLLLAASLALSGSAFAQGAAKRSITQIAGDLYRFQNNFHYSVLLVTPEGVIATDPINADAAKWLKAEIAKRFGQPGVPFRVKSRTQAQSRFRRHPAGQSHVLGNISHTCPGWLIMLPGVAAQRLQRAFRRMQVPHQHPDRGRLAGSTRTEEPEDGSSGDGQ